MPLHSLPLVNEGMQKLFNYFYSGEECVGTDSLDSVSFPGAPPVRATRSAASSKGPSAAAAAGRPSACPASVGRGEPGEISLGSIRK